MSGRMRLIAAIQTNMYLLPVTKPIWYVAFITARRIVLNPPSAALMVDTKNERPKALVRFRFPALSASIAPQEDAYIASERPARTAAPNKCEMLVSRPKIAIERLASTPPPTTNFFLP